MSLRDRTPPPAVSEQAERWRASEAWTERSWPFPDWLERPGVAIISGLPTVDVTEDAEALTQAIMAAGILPLHAFPDAAHVAVSAVHKVDYLLTWNCKHLKNAQVTRRLALVCEQLGYKMPIICTPEELMGA